MDQNRRKIPNAILLPLIEAVNKSNRSSTFDWPSVDIVTDRNNLRKLIGWLRECSQTQDFRIDLQLAGDKTVLMNRWDQVNYRIFSGHTFRYTFEKAFTDDAPGCKDSSNHHRIVTYVSAQFLGKLCPSGIYPIDAGSEWFENGCEI